MTDQVFTVELTQEERRVLIVALDYYVRQNHPADIDHFSARRHAWDEHGQMIMARHKLTQAKPTGHEGTL